ncbi:Dot/Icm T4SS effector Ceg23 [Legionella fallonii]|uniref:Dot/Icm secretion system substrate n=1 Tax=Legionella fallonii LLAP-10 TaxID=1212491 RepID=A0A098G6X2_9GAMM|nr:hypothetical protein [Legionella fallonii]CEG58223.1 protein of unknown function [Legionella fallonii LLAP-10]
MPKEFQVRFKEALNVSGAFDNCFFHTYLLHLIANDLDLPDNLFTFKSIAGGSSQASELQKRFPNSDSLSIFAEYAQRHHPERPPVASSFIFEKILVLGFLMREWFATKMAQTPEIANSLEESVLTKFKSYKDFRAFMEKGELLSGPEGVLYKANEQFLEYLCQHPKQGGLNPDEQRFKQYFADANENVDLALKNFWQREGYQNYCKLIAEPNIKLSYIEVKPVIEMLGQPLAIYDAGNRSTITDIPGNGSIPKMDTKLHVLEGHYYLLRTDKTEHLLGEYERSLKQYTKEREEVLEVVGNKLQSADSKSSLLVGAICPKGHLGKEPFTLLLEKIDSVSDFAQTHKSQEEQQRLAQQRLEEIHKEQQRLEKLHKEQQRLEELHKEQQRLEELHKEQQRLEELHKEQQRLEELHKEQQRLEELHKEQQRLEELHKEQQRLEEPHEHQLVQEKAVEERPIASNKFHQDFIAAIEVLKQKMKDFKNNPDFEKDPKLREAYHATETLYKALDDEGQCYFNQQPSKEAYNNFRANCKTHINTAREKLDKHRGWEKILLNVFAMIVTLGIGYAVAAGVNVLMNQGKFTFFSTDSSTKLDDIEKHVDNKAAPAA